MRGRAFAAIVLAGTVSLVWYPSSGVASGYDWLQFGFDQQHSGNNTRESAITPGNVSGLHKLFTVSLPSVADGAPAYLSGVSTPQGVKDLVFLTTKAGHILARDAQTGASVWSHQYGPGTCHINNGANPCYTTSSPAIDPSRQYIYSYGLDGYVHKYQVGDGTEVTSGGWPEPATLKPFDEKGSSALSIATARSGASYLYVANGGYPGDNGDYQGHITAINLSTGAQRVFNTLCSNQTVHFVETPGTPDCPQVQAAVWARPGVIYDPDTDKIYLGAGNGTFNPASYDWGDSVLALNPDGTGSGGNPLDSYTPTDYQTLQNTDTDLGSTAPAILPAPPSSIVQHLAVQGGKDAKLRLLNLDNLSGQGGPGHVGGEVGSVINVPQGGEILTQPAVWVNPNDGRTWVFVANGSGVSGLQLVVNGQGVPGLQPVWTDGSGGTSPIVANGVLFYAGSNDVHALDPTTGNQLWSDTAIGGVHWESPIVANGVLYITDQSGNLNAYQSAAAPTDTPTSTVSDTSTPTETATTTSTPADTPTATSTPTGKQLVANGGFENGQSPWLELTTPSRQLVSTMKAHTGTHSAYFCGVNYCNQQLWQTVSIPSSYSSLTLSYWYYVTSQETSPYCLDGFHARIRTTTGYPITSLQNLCNYNKTSSWVQKTINLTSTLAAYKGKQVQLSFQGTTNATYPSSFFIDDVSLVAS